MHKILFFFGLLLFVSILVALVCHLFSFFLQTLNFICFKLLYSGKFDNISNKIGLKDKILKYIFETSKFVGLTKTLITLVILFNTSYFCCIALAV